MINVPNVPNLAFSHPHYVSKGTPISSPSGQSIHLPPRPLSHPSAISSFLYAYVYRNTVNGAIAI